MRESSKTLADEKVISLEAMKEGIGFGPSQRKRMLNVLIKLWRLGDDEQTFLSILLVVKRWACGQ